MKINQIVGEHKKGVKAKIYNKKGPEPRKVPKQNSAGNIPTAFAEGDVLEDAAQQVYKVTKSDPNTGLTLSKPDGTQLILPPDKMNAIAANPNDPNKYLLNPDAITQQATSGQPSGPEIGREVEVNAAENGNLEQTAFEEQDDQGDVGGDATDAYIDSIVDQDFERAQGRLRELAGIAPSDGETLPPQASQDSAASDFDNIAVTLDSADGFKDALKKGLGSNADPESLQKIDQLVAVDPDGSVDAEKTLTNMMTEFGNMLPQFLQMMRDLVAQFKQGMSTPEFKQFPPDVQRSVAETLSDLEAQIPSIEQQIANYRTQMQQAQQATANKQRPTVGVQEAKELEAMLRIAGLR